MYDAYMNDMLFNWFLFTQIMTMNTLFTKGHKILLERMTKHLDIKKKIIIEGSGTLEKSPKFSGVFIVMSKEALSNIWNHPEELRNLWNIPEYMVWFYI